MWMLVRTFSFLFGGAGGQKGEGGALGSPRRNLEITLWERREFWGKFLFCWKKPERVGVGGCWPPGGSPWGACSPGGHRAGGAGVIRPLSRATGPALIQEAEQ